MPTTDRRALDAMMSPQTPLESLGIARPYTPTWKEKAAGLLQDAIEKLGGERYFARKVGETVAGGPSSNLPLQMGLLDPTVVGAIFARQEASARGTPMGPSAPPGLLNEAAIMFHGGKWADNAPRQNSVLWAAQNEEFSKKWGAQAGPGAMLSKIDATPSKTLDLSSIKGEHTASWWENKLRSMGIEAKVPNWAKEYGKYSAFDLFPHAGNNYNEGILGAVKSAGFDAVRTAQESMPLGKQVIAKWDKRGFPIWKSESEVKSGPVLGLFENSPMKVVDRSEIP